MRYEIYCLLNGMEPRGFETVRDEIRKNAMFGLPSNATMDDRIQAAINLSGSQIPDSNGEPINTEGYTLERLREACQAYNDRRTKANPNQGWGRATLLIVPFYDMSRDQLENYRVSSEFELNLEEPRDPIVTRMVREISREI